MFPWRRGVESWKLAAGIVKIAMLVAAVFAAGCAGDAEYRREVAMREQAMRASAASDLARGVELEDDGLPSQSPPPVNRRIEPDDPTEPYSPNYGRATGILQRTSLAPAPDEAPAGPRRVSANLRRIAAARPTISVNRRWDCGAHRSV